MQFNFTNKELRIVLEIAYVLSYHSIPITWRIELLVHCLLSHNFILRPISNTIILKILLHFSWLNQLLLSKEVRQEMFGNAQ